MRFVSMTAGLTALLALSAAVPASADRLIGELRWDAERHTLTDCVTGKVYWVRALAANPQLELSEAVRERSQGLAPAGRLLADLEGSVARAPSKGPPYPIDFVLTVSRVHSVLVGQCE